MAVVLLTICFWRSREIGWINPNSTWQKTPTKKWGEQISGIIDIYTLWMHVWKSKLVFRNLYASAFNLMNSWLHQVSLTIRNLRHKKTSYKKLTSGNINSSVKNFSCSIIFHLYHQILMPKNDIIKECPFRF